MKYDLWKLMIGICLGFGIWSLGFPSYGATWLDPALKWKTFETPHFSIHYYDRTKPQAEKMVNIAEEVYERLTPILKHKPDIKTEVVLLDITDFTNGYTAVIPNPAITLYMTDGGSNLRPVAYETWLKYVFLHEYAHVLHLDTVEGTGRLFKYLFGRVSFPNGIMPAFVIEGLATYFETRHGYGGGRGEDPRWEAMMRMDVIEDNLKSLDQAAVDTVRWPAGSLRYLYGVFFLQYIADQYGEDKLVRINQEYGDYLFAGEGVDGLFRNLFGKGISTVWNEWIDHLKNKYAQEKSLIEKEGITKFETLTGTGYYTLKPKWSPDSRYIYYSLNGQNGYPAIRRLDPDQGRDENILEGFVFDDSLSFDGDYLYFTKGDIVRNYYSFKDLYRFDIGKRNLKRLTQGLRAADPAISPDRVSLAYVKNGSGARTLWLLDLLTFDARMIGENETDVQYLSPVFSPDGSRIAVSKWSYGGKQDIYLLNLKDGKEEKVVSYGLSANPGFSPDGQYLLFDSDGSGICNLYAYGMRSKKLFRVTNVFGAAMMPDVSPDGKKIAFVNYSSRGHDIARMDFDPAGWKEVVNFDQGKVKTKKQTAELTGVISAKKKYASSATFEVGGHDYNPLPSFLPKFWLPYTYTDENGPHTLIYTGGIDALSRHYAELQLGYDWLANRPSYSFGYANNQFPPQLSFSLYDTAVPYSWDNNALTYWERERGGGLFCSFFGNRVFHEYDRQVLSVGYIFENLSNITTYEILSRKPDRGDIKGASIGWSYSSVRGYGYSVAPEDGLNVSLRARVFSKALGSEREFTNYSASAGKYFGLPGHHAIAILGSASYIKGDQIVQPGYTYGSLDIRGYPGKIVSGNKMFRGSIEYSFPLMYIESGWGYGLTFFDRVWAKVFLNSASATYGKIELAQLYKSWGGELNLSTITLYGYAPFTLKLGYAVGIDAGGGEEVYFTVGI